MGGCAGLERTDLQHFLFWEGMAVLKELIFNTLYFGVYAHLVRTDF